VLPEVLRALHCVHLVVFWTAHYMYCNLCTV